jgi:hypothetical protein
MYPISPYYNDFLMRRSRTWLLNVDIDGVAYGKDKVVNLEIENSLSPEDDFTVGAAIVSKMILKIRAPDEVAVNARIVPYLSLSTSVLPWKEAHYAWEDYDFSWIGGETERLPLGEFFVDRRERVNNIWVYTCYDKLAFANAPYISSLTYPATQQAVWDEICARLGYTYDSTVQINPSYMIPVAPTGYSYRQVMGYIAGANSASVFVGKDGTIKFRRYLAAETPAFNMGMSDYIWFKQTNPQRTFTRIVVTYNKEDDLKVEAGTGDESQTLSFENPFVTQEIVNDLLANLNGFTYVPVEIDTRGYPQIDVGDRIQYEYIEGRSWLDAIMPRETADYRWDGLTRAQTIALRMTYGFKGGLRTSISAPSKSYQQSEFPIEGTLSGQINRLNKTAIKEGKSYYGATLTRTEGFVVEREDHVSKVTFNSDKMTWEVNGEDSLYYDNIARKLRFKGDIEMEGGSINWTSVNAPDPEDVGALPADDPKLSKLSEFGDYLGSLAQGQVQGLTSKLANINDIGEYIGRLSQGQITGLSERLTKITPTGVYTGTIGTDQLVAGSALISTALIEQLVVGQNVLMGPNATISWGQITDAPNVPVLPDYIKSTYIDQTTIMSPNISAGTITGAWIRTATSGQRVEISSTQNLITAYANDSFFARFSPSIFGAPALFFTDGSMSGYTTLSISEYFMYSTMDVSLVAERDVRLSPGPGRFLRVPDWSYIISLSGQSLYAALDAKADDSDITALYSEIANVHVILGSKANINHTHNISQITNLQAILDGKAGYPYVDSTFAANAAFDPNTRNLKLFDRYGNTIATVNIPR